MPIQTVLDFYVMHVDPENDEITAFYIQIRFEVMEVAE